MRIALVHDWLTGMRGGEAVLQGLCERYPEAPIFKLADYGIVGDLFEVVPALTRAVRQLEG